MPRLWWKNRTNPNRGSNRGLDMEKIDKRISVVNSKVYQKVRNWIELQNTHDGMPTITSPYIKKEDK